MFITIMATEYELPFYSLCDYEIQNLFNNSMEDFYNTQFSDYVASLKSFSQHDLQDCKYYKESEFNNRFHKLSKSVDFSVLHLNIRCLNSKVRSFCQLVYGLDYRLCLMLSCWVNFGHIMLTIIVTYCPSISYTRNYQKILMLVE